MIDLTNPENWRSSITNVAGMWKVEVLCGDDYIFGEARYYLSRVKAIRKAEKRLKQVRAAVKSQNKRMIKK